MVFAASAIIRGSAAALIDLESLEKRAAFVEDIAFAVEQFILARLGAPIELAE
jgi:hypothetical protein